MLLLTHCDWPSIWAKRTLPPNERMFLSGWVLLVSRGTR